MENFTLKLKARETFENFINKCSCSRLLTRPEGVVSILEFVDHSLTTLCRHLVDINQN